jgi:phosphoribosylformylglycinamidine (FGAM) synthase-like enzyme
MSASFGALIHADRVHLREPGMTPPEVMLSESQERMLIEVEPADVPAMGAIAEKYDLGWSDIGEVIPEHGISFSSRGGSWLTSPSSSSREGHPSASGRRKREQPGPPSPDLPEV